MDATSDQPTKPTSGDKKPACEQFLCERCGYSLEGLDAHSGVCPECGRPARQSLPSARVGTPWQIRPGPISYLWTVYFVLTKPHSIWNEVRFDRAHALGLLATTLILSGVGGTGLILVGLGSPRYIAIFAIVFTLILAVLTAIELTGLHVFGRRHGFRMTGNVPLVICAHAVAGWWVSILGMVVVTRVTQVIVMAQLPGARWLEGQVVLLGQYVSRITILVVIAFLTGMICYSLLAGAGYRRLRYVNKPGIDQDQDFDAD